jgi:hypothetical protein
VGEGGEIVMAFVEQAVRVIANIRVITVRGVF